MGKRVFLEPSQLIEMQRRIRHEQDMAHLVSNQVNLVIVISILSDVLEWTTSEIEWFLDRYNDLLMSYGRGEEDIYRMNRNIYDIHGIAIMDIKDEEE